MTTLVPVPNLEVQALLNAIGSSAVSPGAGAAGAVALGLAAACACKAISVSLKHHPQNPGLRSALATFNGFALAALAEADRDARAFEAFVHEKLPASVERLVCEEEQFGQLIAAFKIAIDQVEPSIQPNMAGDVIAAKALAVAAQRIQERNESETLAQR
jgi:formiminotetrahydrofolate cyclodeaminase